MSQDHKEPHDQTKGFSRTFPYNTGTFVIIKDDNENKDNPKSLLGRFGSISCYQCVTENDDMLVMVSGYKDSWCGEYELDEIRPATNEEISMYNKLIGGK